MTKKRVIEIAEELGLEAGRVLQMIREMDVPVRSHMSAVDATSVARLHARLERLRLGREAPIGAVASGSRRRRRRVRPEPVRAEPAVEEIVSGESVEEAAAQPEEATVGGAAAPETAAETQETAQTREAEVVQPQEAEAAGAAPGGVDAIVVESADEAIAEAPEVAAPVSPAEAGESAAPAEAAAKAAAAATETQTPESATETEKAAQRKKSAAPVRRRLASARPAAGTEKADPAIKKARPAASAGPGGEVSITDGASARSRSSRPPGRKRGPRGGDRHGRHRRRLKKKAGAGGGTAARKRREEQLARRKAEQEEREQQEQQKKTTIEVDEFLTVSELAGLTGTTPGAIITSAFANLNRSVTINQRLDFDLIELICVELGFKAIQVAEPDLAPAGEGEPEDVADLEPRPPVVTVMGHVDHGKTSLLDTIRSANVIAGEAGGITQHIGAYHVEGKDGRTVTFLDTPGHEAFSAMRARGAEVTDIVILVVAADDSVMPQTVEAIGHAKAASVPMVVAVNKIDLPGADPIGVKQKLLAHEVVVEEFGGDVLSADVSAKTGEGIDDLLEKVLLQAELLELAANPDKDAQGTVVEAQLDKGMGALATVLVTSGTLRVGSHFVCGLHKGRVRRLMDERGRPVLSAGPGIPVRVVGLEGVPGAGDGVWVGPPGKVREIVQRRRQIEREKEIRRKLKAPGQLENLFKAVQAGEGATLNVLIKADTYGSSQAVADALEGLSNDEVSVQVVFSGIGGINKSDVDLAKASQAVIVGFHVRPDAGAKATAERESVEIRVYDVIYEAREEIRLVLEGLLAPEEREVSLGMAEIRERFRVPRVGTVGGCYVQSGRIRRNRPIRLLRDQVPIYTGRIESLKRFKDDVGEVREGYECGILIENYNDIKIGDVIECYEVMEVARTLPEVAVG